MSVLKRTLEAANPRTPRRLSRLLRVSSLIVCLAAMPIAARAVQFQQMNLVTNDQTANSALLTDTTLQNAWGISFRGTGPFWVSSNQVGISNIYTVNPTTNAVAKASLVVSIPSGPGVTGQVGNGASGGGAFNGDLFLFVSEGGQVSGWRNVPVGNTTAETLFTAPLGGVYKGTAFGTTPGGKNYLYSANFGAGTIDVLDGATKLPATLAVGSFIDPLIPATYAPFNIENLNGKLYVTYAQQDGAKHDDVPGPGHGYVSVFSLDGAFLGRVASQGTLDSPWGLMIAPTSFRELAGALLVGNFGDGLISAFDPTSNAFLGMLDDPTGSPISIDGLWAISPGNNGAGGGSTQKLYFAAGPDGEADGLFGVLVAVPEPGTIALLMAGLAAGSAGSFRRRHT